MIGGREITAAAAGLTDCTHHGDTKLEYLRRRNKDGGKLSLQQGHFAAPLLRNGKVSVKSELVRLR